MDLATINARQVFRVPSKRRRSATTVAATYSGLEALENRVLLTTYTYNVPSGHTAIYLRAGFTTGTVDVHLDSPTGTVGHNFTNISGEDIIDCGSNTSFLFVDQVPAALKPTSDGTNDGIKVQGGSSDTLEIDSGIDDTKVELSASSASTGGAFTTTDSTSDAPTNDIGHTRYGTSIAHLIVRTNDAGGVEVDVATSATNTTVALSVTTSLRIDTGTGTGDTINIGGGDDESAVGVQIKAIGGSNTINIGGDADGDETITASIDFGTESGNTLNVTGEGSATLALDPGSTSPNIVVDNISLAGDEPAGSEANLTISDPCSIGNLYMQGNSTHGGGANLIVNAATSITTLLDGVGTPGGTVTVAAPVDITNCTIESFHNYSPPSTYDTNIEFTGTSGSSMIGTLDIVGGVLNMDYGSDLTVTELDNSATAFGTINAAAGSALRIDTANLDSGSELIFNLTSTADVSVGVFSASGGTVDVNNGGLLTVSDVSTIGTLNVAGTDAAVLLQKGGTFISALTITNGGLVTLQQRADSPSVSTARVLTVNSLDLGTPSGKLDLKDNDLIIDYGTGSTPIGVWSTNHYTGVTGYIASGRNGGSWDGNGLVTSMSLAQTYATLGIAEASDARGISGSQTATFDGVTVDAHSVLVKYTYTGDANLTGTVDAADYARIDGGFPVQAKGYYNGEFTYNGVINADDYDWIDANYSYAAYHGAL